MGASIILIVALGDHSRSSRLVVSLEAWPYALAALGLSQLGPPHPGIFSPQNELPATQPQWVAQTDKQSPQSEYLPLARQ